MATVKARGKWVVHYESGERSDPCSTDEIRALIGSGRVGVDDALSRDGGPARQYFQYDELVDLWDVDESFDIFGGRPPEDRAVRRGAAPAQGEGGQVASVARSASSVRGSSPRHVEEQVDRTDRRAVRGPESSPSPVLPLVPRPWGAPADAAVELEPVAAVDDLELFDFEEPDSGEDTDDTDKVVGPASFAEARFPDGASDERAAEVAYEGYDPLADMQLDPVTVLHLLYDSSLYTVLRARPSEGVEPLRGRYMARAGLVAARQRGLRRSDVEQVAALEGIRRLVFQAFEVLLDRSRREAYEATAAATGRLAAAAAFLGLEVEDAPFAFGSAVRLAEIPAAQRSDAFEAVGEAAASFGLTDEASREEDGDPFGINEELSRTTGQQVLTSRGAGDGSGEHGVASRAERRSGAGVRVYAGVLEAIDSRSHEAVAPVGEIFEKEAPSRGRRQREASRRTAERLGVHTAGGRAVGSSSEASGVPAGLRWGSEESPLAAVSQALGLTAVPFVLSLLVVLTTELAAGELGFAGSSPWFFVRGLLLLGLAVVGTVVVRRERVTSLGLGVPFLEMALAVGFGAGLGLVASLVAPIRLPAGASPVVAVSSMLFMAVAHEAYFRGFVTRVLLVGLRSAGVAIAVSSGIYGLFALSYGSVLGQPVGEGLWGVVGAFALGGVLSLLYWRSRSVWPSAVTHFVALLLALLLAP
jgi:membrane protease YdiL (CAAX protease family)